MPLLNIEVHHRTDENIRLAQRLDWLATELATLRNNTENIKETLERVAKLLEPPKEPL